MKLSGSMKNVAKISSGTALGQIISIVTLPIITRLYGAEVMGSWAAIYAVSAILVYCCDLGLSQAIMIESDEEVEKLYQMVSTLSFLICSLAYVILLGYYKLLGNDLASACVTSFFVVTYAFTMRQVQTCYTWLNREKKYDVLMRNPVINYAAVAVFSILFSLLGFRKYGYFWGVILGQIFTLLNMGAALPKFHVCLDLSFYKHTIKKKQEFVRYQMPAQISVQLRQQVPNLLIGALFGNTMLGYFSISQKLISIPITFIGQSLGKVFYQKAAEMKRTGEEIGAFLKRNMNRAMMVAIIPMILFAAFGDAAIVIFFGKDYGMGGTISRIIVFRSLFTFISTSLAGIDIVTEQQKRTLQTCLMQTVLSSASVLAGYYLTHSMIITVWMMVITFDIMQMWYFVKIYKSLRIPAMEYIKIVVVTILVVAVGAVLSRAAFIQIASAIHWQLFEFLLNCFV